MVLPMNPPTTPDLGSSNAPLARTLPDMLREQAQFDPDGIAALTPDRRIGYAALYQRACALAAALREDGVRHDDRVGVLMANGIEWLEVCFGASMAGAVVVPFSTWSTTDELQFLIADSRIGWLFTGKHFGERDFESDLAGMLSRGELERGALRVIVDSDATSDGFRTLRAFVQAQSREGESTSSSRPGFPLAPGDGPGALDDALVLYTSGSTSRPKGVRLQHGAVIENGFNIGERQGLRRSDRVFLSAPLFWSYGGSNALPAAFTHGAALVLPERFEAGAALALIAQHRCTAIYTLPAMTSAMVRHPTFSPALTASLRTGLTIGSPQDFLVAQSELGVPALCNVYGATETYGNCCVTWHHWPLERRMRTQGTPLPGQVLRFRDRDTGELLGPGKQGLCEVRGYITPGYGGASAQLNATTFTEDGWYRTGDLGYVDADGAFNFVARESEMIKRAGINVSPAELEEVLQRHPGVAQVAVVGVADAVRGERIVAWVVAAPGAPLQSDLLFAHCRKLLSKYKIPDRIEITDAMPLTTTGKLQRKELKRAGAALLAADACTASPQAPQAAGGVAS
ncbi:MAG: class I adenylate-forming enzyme family protein [Lautropia sp.]